MKNKKNQFYIGWQDEMPAQQKSFLKKVLVPLFIIIPILVGAVVYFQNPFNAHSFELGNVKEFTGVYRARPVPILEVAAGTLPEGLSNHILLVGYGKFGAEGIMEAIAKKERLLNGRKITIKGTLIYGDGKAVLELTKKENSLVQLHEGAASPNTTASPLTEKLLEGEILDPKCYFGVMKPGEGKVHKSCAIRCISGGIPPVFRAVGGEGYQYYVLLGKSGEKINASVLDFVGEEVQVSGRVGEMNGWGVLYTTAKDIKR